jgi:hypothetical protein
MKKQIKTPAELISAKLNNCAECTETAIFALRDKEREFNIGLITVLKCLDFAEKQGELPPIPQDWWLSVIHRYEVNL